MDIGTVTAQQAKDWGFSGVMLRGQERANLMLFVYICMQARPFLSYRESRFRKESGAAMDVFYWMEKDILKCAVREEATDGAR